jgi:hypothetical protein
MKPLNSLKILAALGAVACAAAPAAANTITFAPGDYDNTANSVLAGPTTQNNQTTGDFRDVFWWSLNNGAPRVGSDDYINSGNSLILQSNHAVPGSGPYSALNFTGPSVSGGQSYLSIYDTTPGDGATTKNVFNAAAPGGLEISADVLFVKHSVSAGVVALYNEGQDGLALLASNGDGNNPDVPKLSIVFKSQGTGITLASTSLSFGNFLADDWYRVTMDLSVTGDSWTVNGKFQNHSDPTNPNSGLVAGPITTISFTGSLANSDPSSLALTNPGEIGLMAMGNESISLPDNVGVSITNFTFPGTTTPHDDTLPEPFSLATFGFGLAGLALARRRRARRG